MDTPNDKHAPQPDTPAPTPARTADPRLLSGLQGEDGYEIFNDDKAADILQRLRQEREDNRW